MARLFFGFDRRYGTQYECVRCSYKTDISTHVHPAQPVSVLMTHWKTRSVVTNYETEVHSIANTARRLGHAMPTAMSTRSTWIISQQFTTTVLCCCKAISYTVGFVSRKWPFSTEAQIELSYTVEKGLFRLNSFRLRIPIGGSSRKTRLFRLDPPVEKLSRKSFTRVF